MIVQAIANLLSKDWDANGFVTDAVTWAKIFNTKTTTNYSLPGGGDGVQITPQGVITFMGMPVVVQNNMQAGTIIVGDFTGAAIVQSEGLSVGFFEQDSDNIQKNLVSIRLEASVAVTVRRPDAFNVFQAGTT